MNSIKRDLIRRTLQSLAESHAATNELMERALALVGEELAIDAVAYWKARTATAAHPAIDRLFHVDPDRLQVVFQGKACELGDTLFRLLQRLAKRPNTYVTHEDLLVDVWDGRRSEAAIRSAVKRLKQTLRRQGLAELADAVDGSRPGRYRLRVEQ
jgi:DNA-binding response OmpR family regulator